MYTVYGILYKYYRKIIKPYFETYLSVLSLNTKELNAQFPGTDFELGDLTDDQLLKFSNILNDIKNVSDQEF